MIDAFVRLHEQGLIYRGKRLVNWDPKLQTAVSDLEVESEEEDGRLWEIRYPAGDGGPGLVVATTRPETLLGDVAVAVNPDDPRYRAVIGTAVQLPLCDRAIPVLGDSFVDAAFGTGCVKITPAHDFNDFAVGQRHGLAPIAIFTADGDRQRQRPGALSRPRPLCGAQGRARGTARRRAAGRGEAASHDGAALRAHRRGGRADAVGPVVRGHEPAAPAGTPHPASPWPRWRSTRSTAARCASFPTSGAWCTASG